MSWLQREQARCRQKWAGLFRRYRQAASACGTKTQTTLPRGAGWLWLIRQTGLAQTIEQVLGILGALEGEELRAFVYRPLGIGSQDLRGLSAGLVEPSELGIGSWQAEAPRRTFGARAARLSPQVDARVACGRPAQSGIAGKIANLSSCGACVAVGRAAFKEFDSARRRCRRWSNRASSGRPPCRLHRAFSSTLGRPQALPRISDVDDDRFGVISDARATSAVSALLPFTKI